jgi:hypothetical protein
VAERLTVAQEVAGSIPVAHPIPPSNFPEPRDLPDLTRFDGQTIHDLRDARGFAREPDRTIVFLD